jgi:hypothetical protein
MLKNRSFVLAAVIASATTAFTAVPAFASPDHTQAPVAMSGTRQTDREVPAVDHQDRSKVAPTSNETTTAPVTILVKSGFATQPVATDGVFGFGVHVSAADLAATRFGFARAGAVTKVGFASVQ